MDLEGKVALVTGAGRGIGRAIATELAREGADVAVVDLDVEVAEETATIVRQFGTKGLVIQADLSRLENIGRMVVESREALGGIDILVNNAGVGKHGLLAYSSVPIQGVGNSMLDTTEAEWDHIVNVDAKAVFFTMQRVIPVMVRQGRGGRIINVGSAAWKYHPFPSTSDGAYGAAKASVIVMSKTASVQFARNNININVVTPATTRTPQWDLGLREQSKRTGIPFDDLVRRGEARIPTGRMNEPEDVAYMVVFLAGAKARNITGQEFTVDGGLTMH